MLAIVFRYRVFKDWKTIFAFTRIICIRVAAVVEEVVYEVVAEPQVPQGQAPQREVREESTQGPVHPVLSSSSKASPGAQPINLNYDT